MSNVIQTIEELDAVLHWRNKHAIAIKEREALQLLLNERDEQLHALEQSRRSHFENSQAAERRIDELTQRQSENPEGNRERFEKWVMATKHPVFGFLDGRSLARSDDRTGYADEYIQGLWVAYLEFGAEQPKPVSVVPELTPELRWILGQMCFQHIHTAQALRLMGHQIAKKAEDEQAVTIYWMLGHYLKDPANWRQNATAEMKAAAPAA